MENVYKIRIAEILDGLNFANPFDNSHEDSRFPESKFDSLIKKFTDFNYNSNFKNQDYPDEKYKMPESEFITNNFFNAAPSSSKNSTCAADQSVIWIWNTFGQCVLSNVEMFGFYLGMISILCWVFSTVPQLIMNYKSGKVDQSLSVWFLIFWLAGDTCNMVGCILSHQLPMQVLTGIYYVSMDMVMITQYFCLTLKNRRAQQSNSGSTLAFMVFVPFTATGYFKNLHHPASAIGYSLGVISCIFYMASRFPQIVKNFNRGTTAGVSPLMFLLAICGNIFYGSSVLLSKHDSETWSSYISSHLPWLIGSFGTVVLDITILCQCLFMKPVNTGYVPVDDDEDDDLLQEQ